VAEPVVAKPPPPRKKEIEPPRLSLVGTIASDDESYGIFLDQSTKAALRLKVGEDYQGWMLRSIRGGEATMENDERTAVLTLPPPGNEESGEVRVMPVSVVKTPVAALKCSKPSLDDRCQQQTRCQKRSERHRGPVGYLATRQLEAGRNGERRKCCNQQDGGNAGDADPECRRSEKLDVAEAKALPFSYDEIQAPQQITPVAAAAHAASIPATVPPVTTACARPRPASDRFSSSGMIPRRRSISAKAQQSAQSGA
jgi:hypothetical protein